MTVARLGYEIDSSGAVKATGDLDKMAVAAKRADKLADQLGVSFDQMSGEIRAMTTTLNMSLKSLGALSSTGQVSEKVIDGNTLAINELRNALTSMTAQGTKPAKEETDQLGSSLERLRAKYIPLYAASKRYESSLREIAEAEKIGAINAVQAAQARKNAAAGLVTGTTAMNKFSASTRAGAAQTANLGAQFNDIIVMIMAGQNPLQLAAQQGTQINQVTTQMGGGVKALRGLAAGFMSMVNPMSLATIGVIAGGAALVQWAVAAAGAGDEADELAEAMEAIEDSTRNAKLELQAMQMGLANVEQVLARERIKVISSEILAIEASMVSMSGRNLRGAQLRVNAKREEIAAIEEQIAGENEALKSLEQQNYIIESANVFLEAQQRIRNENGAEMERQLRLEESITTELGYGAVEALKLAGVDLSNLDDAARRAASLAASMGIAFDDAYALANVTFAPLGGGLTPDMDLLPPTGEDPNKGRRRGGGGKSEAEKLREEMQRRYDTLNEGLTSETLLKMQQYSTDIETLKWALDQEKITREQYKDELEVLRVDAWGSDFERQRLQYEMEQNALQAALDNKIISEEEYQRRIRMLRQGNDASNLSVMQDFFGEAEGLMQSGNDKLFKIGQAAAIANAVVNGHSAAVAAWDKGMQAGGPPLAAAFTALSLARTGAQISAIKSASSAGSGSGTSSSAGVTATSGNSPAAAPQEAIIQLEGAMADVLAPLMDGIISELQSRSDSGVNIVGVSAG